VVVRVRRGLALVGRVTRPDGAPAVGAAVSALVRVGPSWEQRSASAAADGTFRLAGLPEGQIEASASAVVSGRSAQAKGTFAAGSEGAVLALAFTDEAGPGRIVVRVLDGDGKPVPSAAVRFEARHSSYWVDASNGVAVVEPDERIEGSLWVSDARGANGEPLPLGVVQVEKVAPGAPVVVVRLPPERAIEGTVRDASGLPVAGARVAASASGRAHREKEAENTVVTGPDGSFRVGRLGDGEQLVHVRPPPGYVSPDPVRAMAGATGVDVVLQRGAAVRVTILDAGGKPVRGATVGTWSKGRDRVTAPAVTDGLGVARLDGLAPEERVGLWVHPPRGRSDVRAKHVEDWAPRDETVRLDRAFTFRGRVVDLAGKPVPGATVLHESEGESSTYETDEAGWFVADDLPYAETRFVVSLDGRDFDEPGQTFAVAAGTAEAVFTLDSGLSLVLRIAGPLSPEGATATLFEEKGPARDHLGERSLENGVVTFRGLRAGRTYAVWIHAHGAGHALRTGLRGGDDVRVALTPGATITIRLRGTFPATDHVQIHAHREDLRASAVHMDDRTYEIRGLPAGGWGVQAHAFVDRATWIGSAKVAAGASVDLELVPTKQRDGE
jgi:protocatechuate 3,4-dioxygenase beta subunit